MPAAGSASMDRRLEVTNGGGSRASGSDILLDLMVVPPVNGRCSSRSPARFRTEEVESGGGLDYKSRRSGEGSTAQQHQKRLTSALDSNLNELMVTTTTNTAAHHHSLLQVELDYVLFPYLANANFTFKFKVD